MAKIACRTRNIGVKTERLLGGRKSLWCEEITSAVPAQGWRNPAMSPKRNKGAKPFPPTKSELALHNDQSGWTCPSVNIFCVLVRPQRTSLKDKKLFTAHILSCRPSSSPLSDFFLGSMGLLPPQPSGYIRPCLRL